MNMLKGDGVRKRKAGMLGEQKGCDWLLFDENIVSEISSYMASVSCSRVQDVLNALEGCYVHYQKITFDGVFVAAEWVQGAYAERMNKLLELKLKEEVELEEMCCFMKVLEVGNGLKRLRRISATVKFRNIMELNGFLQSYSHIRAAKVLQLTATLSDLVEESTSQLLHQIIASDLLILTGLQVAFSTASGLLVNFAKALKQNLTIKDLSIRGKANTCVCYFRNDLKIQELLFKTLGQILLT